MAGEVSKRLWYLVLRREGHDPQVIKLPINLHQTGDELDPLIDNVDYTVGYDVLDDETILPSEDRDLVISYELHAVTRPWEANELD